MQGAAPTEQDADDAQGMDDLARAIDIAAKVSAPTDRIVRPRALLAAGVSRGHIARLISIHHLRRALHGWYLVGSDHLTQRQLHRLALLRAGRHGGLTALSGLELVGALWPRTGVATGLTLNPSAVGTHRTLIPMETTGEPGTIQLRKHDGRHSFEFIAGVPVAPMGVLLADLVAIGRSDLLEIAWREAEFRGLLVQDSLQVDLGTRRAAGGAEVGALVDRRRIVTTPNSDVRSKNEVPWLHLMLEAGLPMPLLNAPVSAGGTTYFADYLWVEYNAALELDSPDHLKPEVAARDRARDDDFDSVGINVLRLIDTIALDDPGPHLRRIDAWLRRRGWPGRVVAR